MDVKQHGNPPSGDGTDGDPADAAHEEPGAAATAPGETVRGQLRQLTLRQQRFERYLGRQLKADAAGMAVMDHLVNVGPTTPGELARQLDASTAATTLVIDRLVAAGHASRVRHPTDRRKVIVTPAEDWEAAAYQYVEPLIQGVVGLTEEMTPEEVATVSAFLERMTGIYDSATNT